MFFVRNLSFLHRAEKLVFSVEIFHECSTLAYVCVQFFSDFSEAYSNFEKSKNEPGAGAPGSQSEYPQSKTLLIFYHHYVIVYLKMA